MALHSLRLSFLPLPLRNLGASRKSTSPETGAGFIIPSAADADAASSNPSLIWNEQTRILLHLQQVLMEAIQKIIAKGCMHHSSLPLLARAVRHLSPSHPPVDPSVPLRPLQEPEQQHVDHHTQQVQQVRSEMLITCQELRFNAMHAGLSSRCLAATPLSFSQFGMYVPQSATQRRRITPTLVSAPVPPKTAAAAAASSSSSTPSVPPAEDVSVSSTCINDAAIGSGSGRSSLGSEQQAKRQAEGGGTRRAVQSW